MGKIGLIIKREYSTRVRKKSFLILTALGPLLLAGGLSLVIWIGLQENQTQRVMVIDEKKPVFNTLKNSPGIQFEYIENLEIKNAKDYFLSSNYTSLLYIPKNIEFSNVAILYTKKQPAVSTLRSIEREVQKVVELLKLNQYNIDKNDFYKVKTDFTLNPVKMSEIGEESALDTDKSVVGFVFGLMIYMFIFIYGVQVMRGVIEEKNNRIVEVILTSVKPFQLMLGKVVGVALVGLTQFIIWVALTTTLFLSIQYILLESYLDPSMIAATQNTVVNPSASTQALDLLSSDHILNRINFPLLLSLFLIYFLGGYFLYASMFAAVGALSDSDTDTQQFMAPVTLPLLLAYIISAIIITNPEGPAAFWFSIIPFTSPIVMMVRVAVGVGDSGVPIHEVVLSIFLLISTFFLMVWFSAKVYRSAILLHGKKIQFKDILRWIKS